MTRAGVRFEVVASGIEETRREGESTRDYAQRLANDKALAISSRDREALVLGADTTVECDGQILEKPIDAADAQRMLRLLSGRTHTVVTAFALAQHGSLVESAAVESRVTFRQLSDGEIAEYVASGEPMDKAGAYGIQGIGGEFITAVEGSRDNVMGLPVSNVLAALRRAGYE